MRTLSVVTAFFAIAVHATGAYALNGTNGITTNGLSANGLSSNGLSSNGLSSNGTSAALPRTPAASVDANNMQVFSVTLPKRSH